MRLLKTVYKMARRMTNTDKWLGASFLRSLPAPYKLLWLFINDACDYKGIWQVDFEIARIYTGYTIEINQSDAIRLFGQHIKVFNAGASWFVPDFVKEQYGHELKPTNKVHAGVIEAIKNIDATEGLRRGYGGATEPQDRGLPGPAPLLENGLFVPKTELPKGATEGLVSPCQGDKDMDMNIYMDKEIDKNKKDINKTYQVSTSSWIAMPKNDLFEKIFTDELFVSQLSIVHPGKDYKQAFEEMYLHFSQNKRPPQELGEWKQKLNSWLTNLKSNGSTKNKRPTKGADLAAALAERITANA